MKPARVWLLLGVAALLVSGALSMIVTGAKIPLFRPLVTDLELIRRSLVIHVNLATLVWFTTIPVALSHMARPASEASETSLRAGFLLALFGIACMAASAFHPEANAVLANYIPVLTHPLHDWGLGLFLAAVAQAHFAALFSRERHFPQFAGLGAGLATGGLFFLAACAALALSFGALERSQFPAVKTYFEVGMWGGGHLLQHSSAVFLVVCWAWMLRWSGLEGGILEPERGKWVFVLMASPLTILPFLFALPPWGNEYREGFTELMRWGIAPPMLLHLGGSLWLLSKAPAAARPGQRLARTAWGFSALLTVLGFTFGAFIRGPDLRVPGHYHATIGAVTIMFMVVAYRQLFGAHREPGALRACVWCYGIGQSLFSGGMFTAGLYGLQRKTYGAEHSLTNGGQAAGMAMIALGGLIALAGGLLYGVALYKAWRLSAATFSAGAEQPLAPGWRLAGSRTASDRYSSAWPPMRR